MMIPVSRRFGKGAPVGLRAYVSVCGEHGDEVRHDRDRNPAPGIHGDLPDHRNLIGIFPQGQDFQVEIAAQPVAVFSNEAA